MAAVDCAGRSQEWQEWLSLKSLTDQLPQHFQRGLATAPLQLTCIDAFKDHLLCGTNVGLVYLAHLPTCSLMRLKCENPVVPISCVSVVSTVDDMVAAGALDGTITIFQLPRVMPQDSYSANNNIGMREGFRVTQPTVKRFTVNSIHMASISSLTWSRNGMSLFSGDSQGLVAVVEINYQTSECHARDLLKEESSIVQLSYFHKMLAISTKERSLIYTMEDGNICQVGQRPRKHSGMFGCIWSPSASQMGGEILYTSRPGLRLWSANTKGEVSHTHIIKEVPQKSCIKLLNPNNEKRKEGQMFSFGTLYNLGMSHLVAFNPDWLFIVDMSNLKVAGYSGSFSSITSVAVSGDEVFILEGSRELHCLSLAPLLIGEKKNISSIPSQFPSPLTEKNLKQFGSRIINQSSGLLGQITKLGETVAAKVSEHATPSIVTGDQIPSQSSSDHSPQHQHNQERRKSCQQSLDIRFQASRELNLSDSHKPDTGMFSGSSVAPKMMQSISSIFPGLLSSQGFTKPLSRGATDSHNVEGDQEVVEDLEEIVNVAQIVADERADTGPLVTREKLRKPKFKKKEGAMSDTISICSSRSDISEGMSSSDCLTRVSSSDYLPHSPSATEFSVTSSVTLSNVTLSNIVYSDSSATVESQVINYADTNQNKQTLSVDNTCNDNYLKYNVCQAVTKENEESVEVIVSDKINNNELQKPLVTVDTRTYEDFKTDIEHKEKLLAEILDLSCLKMDHDTSGDMSDGNSTCKSPSEGAGKAGFQRELSVESVGCSTPSTLKELSPLPESGSTSGDFYAQFYGGVDTSLTSVDDQGNDTVGGRRFARMDSHENSEEGCERLNSNNSEGKVSSYLSYGPPSGSSMTSLYSHDSRKFTSTTDSHDSSRRYMHDGSILTRHTDSDVAEVCLSYVAAEEPDYRDDYNDTEEMTAGWIKQRIPSCLVRFVACESYIAFLDNYGYLYSKGYATSRSSWRKLQVGAQDISIPSKGAFMWLLIGRDAYALSWESDGETASSPSKVLAAKGVANMCVDNDVAWYIKHDKKVCVQHKLGDGNPVSDELNISCEDMRLEKLVCRDAVVWALTDTGHMAFRVGVSTASPAGNGWGVLAAHPYKVKDIMLGPFNCGWMLDEHGAIFFRPGVCAEYPQGKDSRWWQVSSSSFMGEGLQSSISVSKQGIWLAESGTQFIYKHSMDITGNYWQISGEENWSFMCAEGLYQEHGAICTLSPKGKLFLINPNTNNAVPLGFENNECVVSVSQRPETLWVLTRTGEIHIRLGLSASSIHGKSWEKLDLHQINDVHLCHISCGTEVVWGVDTGGGVYMRQGPLTPPPLDSLPPAWIQVDPSPLMGTAVFTKVYVGCKNHMVWGIDSSQRIYVREAIFPELPIGISWVPVTGLKALHITISESEVYALSLSGEVYKRLGVAETNYIGDAWEKIPGTIAKISVSTDNALWGLTNSGHLCFHCSTFVCDDEALTDKRTRDLSICSLNSVPGDWEVL